MPVIYLYMQKKKKPLKQDSKSIKKRTRQAAKSESTPLTPTPTVTAAITTASTSPVQTVEQQQFMAKLNQWLSLNKDNQAETNRRRNLETLNDYVTLEQTVTEFLDTFLLIGYNLQGQRVIVQHCSNNRDQDALIELVRNIAVIPLNKPFKDEDMF